MFNNAKVVFLAAILSILHIQAWAQGFYSTYNTPYQNSFAFATPNLKQIFTTKLATGSQIRPFTQQLQDQQVYNMPQQNLQFNNLPSNFFPTLNNEAYSTAPQQFPVQDNELRQQLAYYQQQQALLQQQQTQQQHIQLQQQQNQQQQQYLEQFQAPFIPSQRNLDLDRQSNQQPKEVKNLLGVAYSPSTQVSQVKFDSGKLKYDF